MPDPSPVLWFNPNCSKARAARDLLTERGVEFSLRPYLEQPPSLMELDGLLKRLGTDDPRVILRANDDLARELGAAEMLPEELLATLAAHPKLLERPIYDTGKRAVVARPPERVLELVGS